MENPQNDDFAWLGLVVDDVLLDVEAAAAGKEIVSGLA
jgi:hypothetical protein